MRRCFLILVVSCCFAAAGNHSLAQAFALSPKYKAFAAGEILNYSVHYKWGMVFMETGWVRFTADKESYQNKEVFRFEGTGESKPNWDWFFRVRDTYYSYADTVSLRPHKYVRNTNDGGHWVYNEVLFDMKSNLLKAAYKDKKNPKLKTDTLKGNYLTFDPITMIYYARCIDFNQFKPNDVIPITLYLDNKIYYKSIRYEGKAVLKTELGTFNCIKFRPSLIPGTLFKEGDEMVVWVTDDANKVPLLVETPVVVGSIKAYIKDMSGLRYPLTSRIK